MTAKIIEIEKYKKLHHLQKPNLLGKLFTTTALTLLLTQLAPLAPRTNTNKPKTPKDDFKQEATNIAMPILQISGRSHSINRLSVGSEDGLGQDDNQSLNKTHTHKIPQSSRPYIAPYLPPTYFPPPIYLPPPIIFRPR